VGPSAAHDYFTHQGVLDTFSRHGIKMIGFHNVILRWDSTAKHALAVALKVIPFGERLLDYMPIGTVYQRCYIARA
jgi:hypothetical protein